MKLVYLITLFGLLSLNVDAAVDCNAEILQGGRVRVIFDGNEAVVRSENSQLELTFSNLEHSWDGHGSGSIISKIEGEYSTKHLAIKYDNHFGQIENVVIITDVAAEIDGGHYQALVNPTCTSSFEN